MPVSQVLAFPVIAFLFLAEKKTSENVWGGVSEEKEGNKGGEGRFKVHCQEADTPKEPKVFFTQNWFLKIYLFIIYTLFHLYACLQARRSHYR